MKNITIALVFIICFLTSAFASSSSHEPILIFRTNGVIDLLYSDEVSKIELSKFDADSIEHGDYVSQVFYLASDSILRISIEDIDSVAFGARTSIKPKNNVRRLTDEEANAISQFNETSLFYSSDTPTSLIVSAGETVYYDKITDVLPYGLCAKIESVNQKQDEIEVKITYLAPSEVFDEYLIVNPDSQSTGGQARAIDLNNKFSFSLIKDESDYKISSDLNVEFNIECADEVFSPVDNYYHTRLKLYVGPKTELNISVPESGDFAIYSEKPHRTPKVGPWWLKVYGDLRFFLKFCAEMGLNFEADLGYEVQFEWTRKDGNDYFTNPVVIVRKGLTSEVLAEIHLKGELFFGTNIKLYMSTLFNRIGAGTSIHFGPNLTADFSLSNIIELSEAFNETSYAKAQLDASARLQFETFWFYLEHLLWGELAENELPFKSDSKFLMRTLKLFPDFNTRSVLAKDSKSFVQRTDAAKSIDIAAYSGTNIEKQLDINYEITDGQTGQVIADIPDYTATVNPHSDELQSYNTELVLTDSLADIDPERVLVSPVIKYGEYRVHTRPASVASDMVFSPIIATLTNNSAYFVSGMTPISQHDYEERTYIEGNILPIADSNSKFKDDTANTFHLERFNRE